MTSDSSPELNAAALDLLLSIVETPAGVISGEVIEGYYASSRAILKRHELLKPEGYATAAASQTDHDDEPVHLHWSDEHGGYGYFSPAAGWATVQSSQLALYRVCFNVLFSQVLRRLDGSHANPIAHVPDLLWEVGEVRMLGRSKRVPVWIARRLADPTVWMQFTDALRLRPAPGLRIVLTFTPADRLPAQTMQGHEIINIRDVADSCSLAVAPELLAARLSSASPRSGGALTVAADGASVTVRGTIYAFAGSKQRDVIRQLFAAWESGNRECLTARVLEGAGYSPSVNTLAKAFSGRNDWREFIAEANGRCWIFS